MSRRPRRRLSSPATPWFPTNQHWGYGFQLRTSEIWPCVCTTLGATMQGTHPHKTQATLGNLNEEADLLDALDVAGLPAIEHSVMSCSFEGRKAILQWCGSHNIFSSSVFHETGCICTENAEHRRLVCNCIISSRGISGGETRVIPTSVLRLLSSNHRITFCGNIPLRNSHIYPKG